MRPNLGRITPPNSRLGDMSLTYRQKNGKLYGLFEKFLQIFFGTPYAFRNFRFGNPFCRRNFYLSLTLKVILQEPPALGFRQAGVDTLQKQAAKLLSVQLVVLLD